MAEYIADKIKDEYKYWQKGDLIFISSPTGSGKTIFCLEVLLKYAAELNRNILYLVNRKILKGQLNTIISELSLQYRTSITIQTYQEMEHNILNFQYDKPKVASLENFDYVICDECHYFLTDSNFNTNTSISYRKIIDCSRENITVFLSATVAEIKNYIKQDIIVRDKMHSYFYSIPDGVSYRMGLYRDDQVKEYTLEKNYDYIIPHIRERKEDICDIVTQKEEKWLIFVDNIEYGNKLKQEIQLKFEEEKAKEQNTKETKKVVMLDSNYKNLEEASLEVEHISEKKLQLAKVLISTSVMDNGITIQDIELRNIIILADTKEEFLQMLGRKRRDENKVHLYIYKYSREHFQRRLNLLGKKRDVASEYMKYMASNLGKVNKVLDRQFVYNYEFNLICNKQKEILRKLLNYEISLNVISSIFNVYDGILYLNPLSVHQNEYLFNYYKNVIEQFDEEGEYSFVERQLSWLGIEAKKTKELISEHRKGEIEISRDMVIKQFKKFENKLMIEKEVADMKNDVKQQLLTIIKAVPEDVENWNATYNMADKKGRAISQNNMQFLREYCGIPYVLEHKKGTADYIFRKCEEE